MEEFKPKKYLHILSRGKKWGVLRPKAKRLLRVFKYRELAFNYACNLKGLKRIIVHNKDGTVLFIHENDNKDERRRKNV